MSINLGIQCAFAPHVSYYQWHFSWQLIGNIKEKKWKALSLQSHFTTINSNKYFTGAMALPGNPRTMMNIHSASKTRNVVKIKSIPSAYLHDSWISDTSGARRFSPSNTWAQGVLQGRQTPRSLPPGAWSGSDPTRPRGPYLSFWLCKIQQLLRLSTEF